MILHGDALHNLRLLEDGSVHCIVTSPPYYGLRSYGINPSDWGDWVGVLGDEPTPEMFAKHLRMIFVEAARVLRNDGTLWLNLGDSYAGSGGAGGDYNKGGSKAKDKKYKPGLVLKESGLKRKDLIGVPWRAALALQGFNVIPSGRYNDLLARMGDAIDAGSIDKLKEIRNELLLHSFTDALAGTGLYLRNEIIWAKGISGHAAKNGWVGSVMPESAKDRLTKSHEQVFLFSKSEKYYFNAEAASEVSSSGDELKRYMRTVWTIPVQPFNGSHFATMPENLSDLCVEIGSADKVCSNCGKPYRYEYESGKEQVNEQILWNMGADSGLSYEGVGQKEYESGGAENPSDVKRRIIESAKKKMARGDAYLIPDCDCKVDSKPAVVVDPFCGAGTTGVSCKKLGRDFIGIEMNYDYVKLACKRIDDYGVGE